MVIPPKSSMSSSTDSRTSSSSSAQRRPTSHYHSGSDEYDTPSFNSSSRSDFSSPENTHLSFFESRAALSSDSQSNSCHTSPSTSHPPSNHGNDKALEREQALERAFDASRYRDPLPLHVIDSKLLRVAHTHVEGLMKPFNASNLQVPSPLEVFGIRAALKRSLDHHCCDLESASKRQKSERRRHSTTVQAPISHAVIQRTKSLNSLLSRHWPSDRSRGARSRPILQRKSIILPPPVPEQEIARLRLLRLREREGTHRRQDGLPSDIEERLEPVGDDDLNWGCIPVDMRRTVLNWLYDVAAVPSRKSSRYESFTNLFNHLHCSTETRYLAVALFTRYFHRRGLDWALKLGRVKATPLTVPDAFPSLEEDDLEDPTRMYADVVYERLVWDLALGSLVIAVKVCELRWFDDTFGHARDSHCSSWSRLLVLP
ncbi:hypothetical protein FRB95_001377 [Tulasnella sp. JGI-2019a]|nr:hypothetical protein FRB95_001377 [Tulasnella sp. JGI-2019a]